MSLAGFKLPISPGPSAHSVKTVDELSSIIKDTITSAPALRNVAVRGELQNFKKHSSGHVYFTLLGSESRISAVLFRSHTAGILTWPEDGDEVMVTGSVDVYAKGGAYQLYATRILPLGLGAQSRAKEELRLALEKEGLFDPRLKRPLPKYPSKVAIVTSPTGAAIQDILKVSMDRAPFIDIVVIPAMVQGVDAPPQVARALSLAAGLKGVDCLILARGGGARDDLSPFDDERVVRAVRMCPIPVVTGVGHQTDSSLADLAADAALPTPSAAAERVFPDSGEIRSLLFHRLDLVSAGAARVCDRFFTIVERYGERLGRIMELRIGENETTLDRSLKSVSVGVKMFIERNESILASSASSLDALSPLAVLGRGYSICKKQDGAVIKSASQLSIGDAVSLVFKDGAVEAGITGVMAESDSHHGQV